MNPVVRLSPRLWTIYLGSWIIGDGTYDDFTQGQIAEFSLEFHCGDIQPCTGLPQASDAGNGNYDVVAKCIANDDQVTVLDVGILTWRHEGSWNAPSPFALGRSYRTRLHLGVDAFDMSEGTGPLGESIPLVYTWRIESIRLESSPAVELPKTNPTTNATTTCSPASCSPSPRKPPALPSDHDLPRRNQPAQLIRLPRRHPRKPRRISLQILQS